MNYYNYFTEIEETFVRRRGKNLLLSPIDWAMIEGWQERGVPLHVVMRAIETVFDGFDKKPGPRTIKGLLYCREEVEAQFDEWLKMQTGKSDETAAASDNYGFSRESIAEHIIKAIANLSAARTDELAEDLERACVRLEELKQNLTEDFETVEKTLSDIESFIDRALLANSDKANRKKLENEIGKQLKSYKAGMEPDAYQKTFELMLLKRLREENGIERLSLFYL